ncbi:DUF92 domain-containing protein [Hymenobacter cavernae]|uniref:Membrane protein n=1 Tax=Hymenobacter cavernae TaxID=2044852 RepID=A0ABQ1TJY3_9BACT|nr:DUF92 domain-containing protein [Hymenobacter cavernae]GGE95248.1 membrane protein [Hymenobacter cavernae]
MNNLLHVGAVALILGLGMLYSVRAGKLTAAGACIGGVLGGLLFLGAGFTGLAMLGAFFLLGSAASGWRVEEKRSAGLAEENKGRRTTSQALANGGVAGMLGLLSWLQPSFAPVLQLMIAGSFAAATADTLASELGNIYGRRYYNILTLRRDARGLNGVVSAEGTLLGLAGSLLIAVIYSLGFGWSTAIGWVLVAGTVGNLLDSVLGATLERQQYLSNDAVNFLNTLTGALVAALLYFLA